MNCLASVCIHRCAHTCPCMCTNPHEHVHTSFPLHTPKEHTFHLSHRRNITLQNPEVLYTIAQYGSSTSNDGYFSSGCEYQSILLGTLETMSTKIPEGHSHRRDEVLDSTLTTAQCECADEARPFHCTVKRQHLNRDSRVRFLSQLCIRERPLNSTVRDAEKQKKVRWPPKV